MNNPYYIQVKATEHPKNIRSFNITPNSWRIYLISETNNKSSCHFYRDASLIREEYPSEGKKIKTMVRVLGQKCESGKPLKDLYEEKACHPIHTFDLDGVEIKVWRIRSGKLRLCFIYGSVEKSIIVLRLLYKPKDKITSEEKLSLENLAKKAIKDDVSSFDQRLL